LKKPNEQVHKPKYPVQTLEKALEIIELLSKENSADGLGITELSRRLGIGKSNIHRILDTLMAFGYVEKTISLNKYRLTWKMFQLGNAIPRQRKLSQLNIKMLRSLCEKYQETINLGVREGSDVIIVSKVDPETALKVNFNVGEREPFYATALGKVLCSELDREQIENLYKNAEIKTYTAKTITDLTQLIYELDRTRKQGFAIDDEELSIGLCCIAMPVRNYNGDIVAAVSVSGPSFSLNFNKIMDVKDDLAQVCHDMSRYLGYGEGNEEPENE